MDVVEAIHKRRSIRSFLAKPVDRKLIESVICDAAQAPPPFQGRVPWTFNVVQGVDRIAELDKRAMDYARAHHRSTNGDNSWLERPDFRAFWGAPAVIVISGAAEDCVRAGQNLMLSAVSRGLGTCWVGSPMLWLSADEGKAEFGIPPELTPVSAFCIGYPRSIPEMSQKVRPPIIWAD